MRELLRTGPHSPTGAFELGPVHFMGVDSPNHTVAAVPYLRTIRWGEADPQAFFAGIATLPGEEPPVSLGKREYKLIDIGETYSTFLMTYPALLHKVMEEAELE